MKKILCLALLELFLSCVLNFGYEIHSDQHSITGVHEGMVLWKYNHDRSEGKPYFHPLANSIGTVLTDLRPKDHPWHRGLWFSWKYINQVNYWEEDRKTGLSDGETHIVRLDRKTMPSKEVHIEVELSYAPRGSEIPVLLETRKIVVFPPEEEGHYQIDWSTAFTAGTGDVIFDRTPIPGEEGGKNWGGYAGLSLRMCKDVLGGTFLNSDGLTDVDANRQAGRWMAYQLPTKGSVLIMDHPDNLRFPNKWYIVEKMPFFSPVVIHDGPFTLPRAQSFGLKFRIVISPDVLDKAEAESRWSSWQK